MRLSCNLFYPLTLAAAIIASVVAAGTAIESIVPIVVPGGAPTGIKINGNDVGLPQEGLDLFDLIKTRTNKSVHYTTLRDLPLKLTYEDGSVIKLEDDGASNVKLTSTPQLHSPKYSSNWSVTSGGGNLLVTGSTTQGDFYSFPLKSEDQAIEFALALNADHQYYIYSCIQDNVAVSNVKVVGAAGGLAHVDISSTLHQCFRRGDKQLCIRFNKAVGDFGNLHVTVRPYILTFLETTYGKSLIAFLMCLLSVFLSAFFGSRIHYYFDPEGYKNGYVFSSIPGYLKQIMQTPNDLTEDQMELAFHNDEDPENDYYGGQGETGRRTAKNRPGAVTEAEDEIDDPSAEEVDARAFSVAAVALLLPFLL
jgi:hypothetical protein